MALEIALRERVLLTVEGRIQWASLLLHSLEGPESQSLPQSTDDEFQDAALEALDALETPSSFLFETALLEEAEVTPRSFSPLSVQQQPQRSVKTRPSRVPKISQPKKLLYIRLPSGEEASQLAILACPACSRTQFSTLQGLLNHARLAHGVEWASHDACITACAVPFNPEDDTLKTYEQDGVEVPWGGNVVGLRRLFERAVGVEGNFSIPHLEATQLHDTQQHGSLIPSTLLSRTLGLHAESPSLAPFLGRVPKRRCIHVHDEEEDVDIFTLDKPPHSSGVDYGIERISSRFSMTFPHRNAARPELDLAIDLEAKAATKMEAVDDPASILSNAESSRFHITARVRVEDRSLYLSKGGVTPSTVMHGHPSYFAERQIQLNSPHQYRWMIAVTAPSYVGVWCDRL